MATIPHGFGAGSAPFTGNFFNYNYNHALREAGANAETFEAKHAYATIVYDDLLGRAFLYFMHDGKPFDNIEEILSKGLMPNDSGGKGNSLQGAGLTFTASFLNGDKPELAIGSMIGGKMIGGKTRIVYDDILGRSWSSLEDEDFAKLFFRHFDEDSFAKRRMNVVYRWEIPYKLPEERETAKKTEEAREDGKGKVNNTLQLIPGHLMDMAFDSGEIFRSVDLTFSSSLIVCDKESKPFDLKDVSGHTSRRVCGLTEYKQRYIPENLRWRMETGEFDVEIGDRVFRFAGHVEVVASEGKRGAETSKSHGDQAWLETVTENRSNQVFPDKKWEKGSCSREGYQPTSKLYLKMPLFNKISDMATRNAYKRFTTNALYRSHSVKPILLDLGVNYFPDKKTRPFAVVTISVDKFLGEVIKGVCVEKSTNYLDDMLGRRPDFWLKDGVGRLIINQAIKYAKVNVPQAMTDWFEKQFPATMSDEVPLFLETPSGKGSKSGDSLCQTWDLVENKAHSNFNAGGVKWLAVFHKAERTFISDLTTSSKTRGAVLRKYSAKELAEDKSIKPRVKTRILKNLELVKVQFAVEDVTFYRVKISKLRKLNVTTGRYIPGNTEAYRSDLADKVERNKWIPSRSIQTIIHGEDRPYNLGPVVEVPAIKGSTKRKRGGAVEKPTEEGEVTPAKSETPPSKQKLSPFCIREDHMILQWRDGITQLNRNNVRFKYFLYRDREGTESQKLCNKIYKELHRVADLLAKTLIECEEVKVGEAASKLDGCDTVGSMAKYDFPVNQTISRMLDDGWMNSDFVQLARIRERAESESAE